MATQDRQSKLRRYLPLLFLVALSAKAFAADIEPSNYTPQKGDRFFLLSETGFGSDETAAVRLEAPERGEELEEYPEADLVVYRVPDPIGFLKGQQNLHRIQVKPNYRGEGLANALRYVWDSWYKKSRLVWQRLFSAEARAKVVEQAPLLKQTPPYSYTTQFEDNPQFRPLAGFEPIAHFRYPLWVAKPIQPPEGVKLAGSSSDFITPRAGNVMIPLGKLKPGLYLVEAYIGKHRATTVVFVSDTVAVAKVAREELLVWTADQKTGRASGGAKILLTDATGTLESGATDRNGLLLIHRKSPERSYVIGTDAAGGVFVSENFYYDSEILGAKLYAFTDRPLYRPGDTVCVKLVGRVFQDARHSTLIEPGTVHLAALDPNGTPVATQDFDATPESGGDTCFPLPDPTASGGYTLRLGYRGAAYSASFRVAEYELPNFEVDTVFDRKEFETGETVKGRIRLTYPGGKPVRGARVEVSVRAQPLTMVEGELRYQGLFPVKLLQSELAVGEDGSAAFELPAAPLPSRYVLSVVSTDAAAFRVTAAKEILIRAGRPAFALTAATRLSRAGEPVELTAKPLGRFQAELVIWEAVRLEDQSRTSGEFTRDRFEVRFPRSGSYMVNLKDREGHIAGSLEHWVAGPELKSMPGSISIVFDKDEYAVGETAHALVTFPVKVDEALATLERDGLDSYGLFSDEPKGIRLTRQNDLQWTAEIPVGEDYRPNITFSVLYVQDGGYVFQNKGVRVATPKVRIDFTPEKAEVQPGETVNVAVQTTLEGKPVAAHLTVGVVDEMVYVLQPEIAPPIDEFFYHSRRNQVRTSSSLNFHSYDMAVPAETDGEPRSSTSQRSLKVPDRPRREDIDTALWLPNLTTGEDGKARFSFIMPDSIARWRITGRATTVAGGVGQATAYVASMKDYYLKWSGPAAFREGDEPKVSVLGFNATAAPAKAVFTAEGLGADASREVVLDPGANRLEIALKARRPGGLVSTHLAVEGKPVDHLEDRVAVVPSGWPDTHAVPITLDQTENEIPVPAGATNVRLSLAGNATDGFLRIADDLIDYPFGCVEQTASRLIPLALAYQHVKELGLSDSSSAKLHRQLTNQRLRLARLAGPESAFGWWGDVSKEDLFLTAYAYYSDWNALRALGIEVPADHWEKLLDVYKSRGEGEPLFRRAIVLWLMDQMGLPTRTLVEGAIEQSKKAAPAIASKKSLGPGASGVLDAPATDTSASMAMLLLGLLAEPEKIDSELGARIAEAKAKLQQNSLPLAQALSLLAGTKDGADGGYDESAKAQAILDTLGPETATIDRALSLVFVHEALGFRDRTSGPTLNPGEGWAKVESALGAPLWTWHGPPGAAIHIMLKEPPPRPLHAYVTYEGYGLERRRLSVRIARRLYRLQRGATEDESEGSVYDAVPVEPEWNVTTSDLYLDEVEVKPTAKRVAYKYGVLEIPLPPGAGVESTTWGVNIAGLEGEDEAVGLTEPIFTPGDRSYSVPVDVLKEPQVYRHLIRFSERGRFGVPPARYFRMYQPSEKALEEGPDTRRVDVE